MSKARITVRFIEPGFHRWPGATEERAYLADRHRHLFYVAVTVEVDHDDREIEFHDLLEVARAMYRRMGNGDGEYGSMSCEAMARQLGQALAELYSRPFEVSVYEDNEVGATVTVQPS
jgi:hypothetical protein